MMSRPEWDTIHEQADKENIYCSCGVMLTTIDMTREHWQRGHFDQWEPDDLKLYEDLATVTSALKVEIDALKHRVYQLEIK